MAEDMAEEMEDMVMAEEKEESATSYLVLVADLYLPVLTWHFVSAIVPVPPPVSL